MKRVLAVGAISAMTVILLVVGNHQATAQLSPLPTPDAALAALEIEAEWAVAALASERDVLLIPSVRLRDAARGEAQRIIGERLCWDAMDLAHLWRVVTDAGYVFHRVRAAQSIHCGEYTPAEIAHGLSLSAWGDALFASWPREVGVGIWHEGEQWRWVVVTVDRVEQEPRETSGTDSSMGAYVPVVSR